MVDNILLISEHYAPKVGGTVTYVNKVARHLANSKRKVYLMVPGVYNEKKTTIDEIDENLKILSVSVAASSKLEFTNKERDGFCAYIKNHVNEVIDQYDIDIVHLLYGLFVADVINTDALRAKGVKVFHTIHNIPPEECSLSWRGDNWIYQLKDKLRKIGVKAINKKRITNNAFDKYIVPSINVKQLLAEYINSNDIVVIDHGVDPKEFKQTRHTKEQKGKIEIVTVGGFVPHKNQHLVPRLARYLADNGIEFQWTLAGPVRNKRYFKFVENQVLKFGVNSHIEIKNHINDPDLKKLYQDSDLYIHLSSEEGFCMTVLDAICNGVPVISTAVGAIPQMMEKINGTLIDLNLKSTKKVLVHYCKILPELKFENQEHNEFVEAYSWDRSIDKLLNTYNG